ncbi:MAG TPA: metalloregulator ArsR/SmtB family transcription factor [Silvibacterium sp.]|jgi:DNA-binding transcriptional ArsR family regulator|nr:metalloregulator ArsR/SmtB family transcription factor [Silvibacterium sp.]
MAYVEKAFEALGDPTRLAIFQRIATRPHSVGEIAGHLPVSRPAVSQHLRVLKQAGLVADVKDGTRRVYEVRPEGIEALRRYFDQLWDRNLKAFQAAAEKRSKEKESSDDRNTGSRARKKVH